MGLSAEQEREIEAYLGEVTRVLQSLTDPERTALTVTKLRERIQTALSNGSASRDDAVRMILDRLGDPIRLGVRLARTWGSEETGPQPPELPAIIQGRPVTGADPSDRREVSRGMASPGESDKALTVASGSLEADLRPRNLENADKRPADGQRRKTRTPVWLGLCAWLNNEKGIPVWISRPLLVLVGLAGWPLMLSVYVLAYWAIRLSGGNTPGGRVRMIRLILDPLLVGGLCGLLYAAGQGALRGLDWVSLRYLDHTMLDRLGAWNWLEPWQHAMLAVALAYAIPPAILGAMPVSGNWSSSLRRFALALAALYGLAVVAGIACLIAGSSVQMSVLLMGK